MNECNTCEVTVETGMTVIKLALRMELLCDVCSFCYQFVLYPIKSNGYLAVRNARHISHPSNMYDLAITLPCTVIPVYLQGTSHSQIPLDIEVHGHQCNIHVALCSETQLHLSLVGPVWK